MKKIFLVATALIFTSFPVFSAEMPEPASAASEVMRLLVTGDQAAAETKLAEVLQKNPNDPDCLFLEALCERSRFNRKGAISGFLQTIKNRPESPEGQAAACVLGMDLARDQSTGLYYYNALLMVARRNPTSVPVRWLAAIMARTLTRGSDFKDSSEMKKRIVMCGIREYQAVLALVAPGKGPVLVHQTLANLLDEAEGFDQAWRHREIAMQMTRAPWCLQASALTLLPLDRGEEALSLMQEAMGKDEDPPPNYWYTLGNAYWRVGLKKEALKAWETAARMKPGKTEYLYKGMSGYRYLGDYASAKRMIQLALVKYPDYRLFRIWDARFAALLGEQGAAEQVLKAGTLDFRGNPEDLATSSDPWFLAVETGDFLKVRQLMGSGDINRPNPKDSNQTALMAAACAGWEPIVVDLIRAGAKLDVVDANGDTALHYSAQFEHPRILKLLLEAGANPNTQDKWKQTPLIMCASKFDRDGLELLVQKKADLNLATPHGGTALHYAAGWGKLDMLNTLISAGADVHKVTLNNGETPLITACKDYPHPFIVSPLIEAGVDVNARDKNGRTALHHAVNPLLNIPLVQLLLEKGAKPALADNLGITPIAQARLLGFENIAKDMERRAGTPERFQFPQFESPDKSLSIEEKNACSYVLPILLAQGHPLGRASGVAKNARKEARKELRWMFEIETESQMKEQLRQLEAFDPRHRDAVEGMPTGDALEKLGVVLKASVKKIHGVSLNGVTDETAWIKTHVIYLADLGMIGGFLTEEEGGQLIRNASSALKGKYGSWPEFVRSFTAGAQIHNAWEAVRYEEICSRILEAHIPWP